MEQYHLFFNYFNVLKNIILRSIQFFVDNLWINILAVAITVIVVSIIFYEKRNSNLNRIFKFVIIILLSLFELFVILFFYKVFGFYSLLFSLLAIFLMFIDNIIR